MQKLLDGHVVLSFHRQWWRSETLHPKEWGGILSKRGILEGTMAMKH